MYTTSSKLGRLGEKIASKYLKDNGYKILHVNYSKPRWGEIDIIALDKKELVFVEVKTRRSAKYGDPIESISHYKLRALQQSINYYLLVDGRNYRHYPMRIDAIGITVLSEKNCKISHIKSVN